MTEYEAYRRQILADIKATQEEMKEAERAQARRGRVAFLDIVRTELWAVENEVAKFYSRCNNASERWRCKPLSDAARRIEKATQALIGGKAKAAEKHIRQADNLLKRALAELLATGLDMAILFCALDLQRLDDAESGPIPNCCR
jgi:hypothetical protein